MSAALSLAEARRLAIASQGFGKQPSKPTIAHVRNLASQIHAFQIDSVNVLVRAHYVPAFARLGAYPMAALDTLTYRRRELFEFWGHAACLLPMSLYHLLRYRMHTDWTHEFMQSDGGAYIARVYAEVAERGPIAAGELSNPGKRTGNWWGWASGKTALEHLYNAGLVAIAGRRGFERMYDLTERVIPARVVAEQTPPREEAMKQLICLAARAYGVGSFSDISGYFMVDGWRDRMRPEWWFDRTPSEEGNRARPVAKRLVAELVDEGRLVPAKVEGWTETAYVLPDARVPRSVHARALVTPFDSLVWERKRVERMWGMKYSISLYTPVDKREHGYYVCPFLLGDELVARCDLKADRQRRVLLVQSAFLEPGQSARRIAPELAEELCEMQAWLELERIEVANRGDLASSLEEALPH
jgi:uncharacterized protein YcaQ